MCMSICSYNIQNHLEFKEIFVDPKKRQKKNNLIWLFLIKAFAYRYMQKLLTETFYFVIIINNIIAVTILSASFLPS